MVKSMMMHKIGIDQFFLLVLFVTVSTTRSFQISRVTTKPWISCCNCYQSKNTSNSNNNGKKNQVRTLLLSTKSSSSSSSSSSKSSAASSSTWSASPQTHHSQGDQFIQNYFMASDADNVNTPPSLSVVLKSLDDLANGSDIRGRFIDHPRIGRFTAVAQAINAALAESKASPLTPLAAYCLGYGFASMMKEQWEHEQQQQPQQQQQKDQSISNNNNKKIRICIGTDPRPHGIRLADSFSRGCASVGDDNGLIEVVYTGIATTPSMMDFCRTGLCDAAVMLTASHLPVERNGMKFFVAGQGGFTKSNIKELISLAKEQANFLQVSGTIPPTSGEGCIFCAQYVDFMTVYAARVTNAIQKETSSSSETPLEGIKIVLNSGCGSGTFFYHVLEKLGADVSASIGIHHDSTFPLGVPNPESKTMVEETIRVCQETNADIGIMLDTDADRSGFIVPGAKGYEPLNRNRLIALLGVIFQKASPGCTFVTDSVTSEGLQEFLEDQLGLFHVRYLKGYANVIGKAKELTESGQAIAEVAIETSGHCAMRENDYLDDGTYTAVKILGLLAKMKSNKDNGPNIYKGNLLHLIAGLKELPESPEFRLMVRDESLESTNFIFDIVSSKIEWYCNEHDHHHNWKLDLENLEGLRVRTNDAGGFFMIRKSLHDPIVSLQVEGDSVDQIRNAVVKPLCELLQSEDMVVNLLDLSALNLY